MGSTFRTVLRTAAALLPLALHVSSPASAETTLRVVPHADLKNIDPIWTTAYITRNHSYLVWDTLFSLDENFQPQPQMVESWKASDDKMEWTFTLRDGLKFHDGAPVTSADVVSSLERWGKRDGMGQQLFAATETLEAVDDKTFRLKLKSPFGLVLESFGKLSSNVPFIMPKRLAETDPFKQVPEVVGSGPFRFMKEQWVPGSKVVYTKFADYVPRKEAPSNAAGGKVAKVDRIEWLYIPDPNTAMNALISGEVDYYENAPADLVPILRQAEGVKVETLDPLGNQGMLRFNHLHPPFDKPELRKAVSYVFDQEQFLQAGVGDPAFWQKCYSYFACNAPVGTDAGAVKQPDMAKAKELMKAGGYDGTPVTILQATDIPVLNAAALVTAQGLREAGFTVDLQAMDWATVTSRRAVKEPPGKGGWNVFFTWTLAADLLTPLATNLSAGCDKAWFGWPCDEKIETWRAAYPRATDDATRKDLVEKIQERNYTEVLTHLPIGAWFSPVAYRSNLSGVVKSPVSLYWNIEKK